MPSKKEKVVEKTKIATIGSHSALQILKGAKDEGFSTIAVCLKKNASLYEGFDFIDEVIEITSYKQFPHVEKKLIKENAVIVPHGSFVAYLGLKAHKEMRVNYYGNKDILEWEADRRKQRKWLSRARLNLPKQFKEPYDDIDRPVIIKFHGALGGRGYVFARNKKEFMQAYSKLKKKLISVQEYIIGVPLYIHYFYSNLSNKLEIMSIDRRYETNVDSLGRIPLMGQRGLDIKPSYVVVGNSPLVLRESLLGKAFRMGERTIKASKKIAPPKGLFGPFCLETVITPEQRFYVIEVSARIVAGTNLFINGSPYSFLSYKEPMSTGRRIAREIKTALQENRLKQILS